MCFRCAINEQCLYRAMFVSGATLTLWTYKLGALTLDAFLLGFPTAGVLIGSYFWIRLDVWRDDETIERLSTSNPNKSVIRDLVCRRVDSRAALIWLFAVTIFQGLALLLSPKEPRSWLIFSDVLLLGPPITAWLDRLRERHQLSKF